MKSTINLMRRAAVVIVLALAFAPLILGLQEALVPSQGGGRSSSDSDRMERTERERARERQLRERELREREFMLRMLEKEARRPVERQEPHLALAQIKEDFLRIQVVNNDLAQAVSSSATLDLKLVAKSASEIKKRAGRLKYNLVLPESEKGFKPAKAEIGAEPEQLRVSLSALSELVVGFVNNPMFKTANVVDAQQSAKARRHLEEIIELSDGIKKSSEKLSKAVQKSQ